jgi:hypothetical protein
MLSIEILRAAEGAVLRTARQFQFDPKLTIRECYERYRLAREIFGEDHVGSVPGFRGNGAPGLGGYYYSKGIRT